MNPQPHIHHNQATAVHPGLFDGANRILLVAVVVLLLYYVVQANTLAADTWRLRAAQDQLSSLRSTRDGIVAQQGQLSDRSVLTQLAAQQGMVPAGTVAYLIQSSDVATAR